MSVVSVLGVWAVWSGDDCRFVSRNHRPGPAAGGLRAGPTASRRKLWEMESGRCLRPDGRSTGANHGC